MARQRKTADEGHSPKEPESAAMAGGLFGKMLRQAIDDSQISLNWIGQRAGVDRGSLSRFVNKKRELSLKSASDLAEVLGLHLVYGEQRFSANPAEAGDSSSELSVEEFQSALHGFIDRVTAFVHGIDALFREKAPGSRATCAAACARFYHAAMSPLARGSLHHAWSIAKAQGRKLTSELCSQEPTLASEIVRHWLALDSPMEWETEAKIAAHIKTQKDQWWSKSAASD
jgi:hypothetical protein